MFVVFDGPATTGLYQLARHDALPMSLSDLTNNLNMLEDKGMITRKTDESDSRTKLVSVSKSFAPKCAGIEKDLRNKMRKSIYSKITPTELTTYIKVLYKLSSLETN